MKRIVFPFLVLISLACAAPAATRPHYGGTLRVSMQSAPLTLEMPAIGAPVEYWDMARVLALVAEPLVRVDVQGHVQAGLAVAWQSDSTWRHWQFTVRNGVKFHDGGSVRASAIAVILKTLHPDWNISASAEAVTIDVEPGNSALLAELALPQNFILTRNASRIPVGTGPFRVTDFQPGKLLTLAAHDDYWGGRPYVDAVEIEFGKSLRDAALAGELGRADVFDAMPQATNSSPRVRTTLPKELLALVFTSNSRAQDIRLREALADSIDRKPILSVLLKGAGEPAATLLPNWMTGYAAAFPSQRNLQRAKALLSELRQPPLTLSYDPRDPQAQLIAERIALNAREVGIAIQVSLSGVPDVRLERVALPSADAALSLRELAKQLTLAQPVLHSSAVDDLYQAERSLLDGFTVIPLFHLPVARATGVRVRGWAPDLLGRYAAADLWLEDSR